MSTEPIVILAVAAAALSGLVIAAAAMLRGWQGWLDLKRAELEARHSDAAPPSPVARIELADLKERIRKLEEIAAGVDF